MISRRSIAFPSLLQKVLDEWFKENNINLTENPASWAAAIKRLSDIYHNRTQIQSLWNDPKLTTAYLIYFFSLNACRITAVWNEVKNYIEPEEFNHIIDFGSGPGTFQMTLSALGKTDFNYQFIEHFSKPIEMHKNLLQLGNLITNGSWSKDKPTEVAPKTLAVFCYSLNEISELPRWVDDCEALLIIEPSVQEDSRKLLELRQKQIENGWFAWAPCTHNLECPLLKESKKDWCHDRIFIEMPNWYQKIEAHLPMKNNTLTYSYLFMKKNKKPAAKENMVRVTGDTLYEKGKTRQMVCRSSKREFLSVLTKDKINLEIPRGSLYALPENIDIKGNEIRLKG